MNIDEIYLAIGQSLVNVIDEPWQKATLVIKRVNKAIDFQGNYLAEGGETKGLNMWEYSFNPDFIHELHAITTEGGHNRWNNLNFILYPTGKFEMDFIWDQEYQDEIDRLNKKS